MVKVTMPSYEAILEQVTRVGGSEGRDLVERAYGCAQQAHEGQFCKSGDPYITHCLAVAGILSDLNLDPPTIAAALLHDVIKDTPITSGQLKQKFGPLVASMVDGVTKLAQFDVLSGNDLDINVEELRKKFVVLTEGEIRIALIKLADRLHNMRTLKALPEERRQHLARETMEIFAPLASRLGIWQMKWEMEDLAFRYLNPRQYKDLVRQIDQRKARRDAHVAHIVRRLKERLEAEDIPAEVKGRAKHIYSIYNKMRRKDVPFEQIFDVRAVRVIVNTVSQCYQALGIIHNTWRPIPGEFDDYIATPKENGYRSLHTSVMDEDGTTLEVQIRTYEMHHEAEYGVAAHWKYKEGGKHDAEYEQKLACLRSSINWREAEAGGPGVFTQAVRIDLFQDRVYVSTPQGKLFDLPAGSTPIDFAYQVHTSIGDRCRGAKVNGKIVSLDYQLKTGDKVEILTAKQGGPSRDWLNPHLGFIKTSRARAKIRQWFRRQSRQQKIAEGRAVLEKEMKRMGIDALGYESIARAFECKTPDDLFAAIGQGDLNAHQLLTTILEIERAQQPAPETGIPPIPPMPQPANGALVVHGTAGLLTNLAQCCHPLPGHPIIGYVTRGRGVTIHRQDCSNILRTNERERLIDVRWGPAEQTYPVMIKITAYDRAGLLRDIGAVVANQNVSMSSVSSSTQKSIATIYATLQVSSIAQLSRVLSKLEQLRNVIEVRRRTD